MAKLVKTTKRDLGEVITSGTGTINEAFKTAHNEFKELNEVRAIGKPTRLAEAKLEADADLKETQMEVDVESKTALNKAVLAFKDQMVQMNKEMADIGLEEVYDIKVEVKAFIEKYKA